MIRGLLCDVHGVLYTHPDVIPGSVEAVRRLQVSGLPFSFLTNSTQFPKRHTMKTLLDGGFDLDPEQLLTAPEAAGAYLAGRGHRRIGWLCASGLAEDLPQVEPVDPDGDDLEPVDAVLVGDFRERFTFAALNRAFRWIHQGAELVALARTRFYQASDGLTLDAGPFVRLLEEATQVEATVMGKPSRTFFETGLERLGLPAEEVVMVGDDLDFDVLPAMDLGMRGVLVRSGKHREDRYAAAPRKADIVTDNLLSALPAILE